MKPIVSVRLMVYQNAPYIRECIDSVLMQQTDFLFEICIGEDGSTDGTREICLEYQKKYPDIVKVFLWNRTLPEHRALPPSRYNFINTIKNCQGKYIALLDGDDYWIDPHKLQRQVDFLDANPDYILCYHNAKIIDENGNVVSESKMPEVGKKDYTSDEIIRGSTNILTLSLLFRNVIKEFPPEMKNVKNGDNFLTSMLGNYGKGKFMPEITPGVYRTHGAGVWSTLDNNNRLLSKITTYFWLHLYYERIGKKSHADYYILRIKRLLEDKVPSPTNKNQHIFNSKSYKIGRAITYPYRFIMRMKNLL